MTTRHTVAITFLVTAALAAPGWAAEWHNTLRPISIPSTIRPKGLPTFTHRSGRSPAFRLYERKLRVPGATVRLDYRKGLPEFHHRGTPVPAFHASDGKRIPRRNPRILPAPPKAATSPIPAKSITR